MSEVVVICRRGWWRILEGAVDVAKDVGELARETRKKKIEKEKRLQTEELFCALKLGQVDNASFGWNKTNNQTKKTKRHAANAAA